MVDKDVIISEREIKRILKHNLPSPVPKRVLETILQHHDEIEYGVYLDFPEQEFSVAKIKCTWRDKCIFHISPSYICDCDVEDTKEADA